MLRNASHFATWCAADPGPIRAGGPGSAEQREERCTASGTRESQQIEASSWGARSCAPRRMSRRHSWPSFEARRRRRAPQD